SPVSPGRPTCSISLAGTARSRLARSIWNPMIGCATQAASLTSCGRSTEPSAAPACPLPCPRLEARNSQATQAIAMKQQANLIRAGQVIEHDGRRWTVLKQQIITPGKGGAFIQVEIRDLKSGNKTNERWRTADTVERLMTEEKQFTYSYTDGANLVLMDPESYEETHIPL